MTFVQATRRRTLRTGLVAASAVALVAAFLAGCGSAAEKVVTGGVDATGAIGSANDVAGDAEAHNQDVDDAAGGGEADDGNSVGEQVGSGPKGDTVTLITHDSFAIDPDLLASFEEAAGITVQVLAQGDAGEMVSKLALTKDNPLGDVVFGIDNTLATKAINAGVLAPYHSSAANKGADDYALGDDNLLTAVDYGDVCINIDHTYFADHDLAEPTTFEDLAAPTYAGMLVAPDAATSSPGLAFLLATVAHFGADGWQEYWQQLVDNDVKITSGWTDAYTVDFSGSSGQGDRPLVVSYASSPPSEVPDGAEAAPTGALLDTCFRQVEYAGVLANAEHPQLAEDLIDFLLSSDFQRALPETMWMYPVDRSVPLPADWAEFAPVADSPAQLDPSDIDQYRQEWVDDWTDIVHG